jgi:hypothetical protein
VPQFHQATVAGSDVGTYDVINTFQNQEHGYCLESDAVINVYGAVCDGGTSQQWWVHSWADGTVQLQNAATGQCLENYRTAVYTSPTCHSGLAQSWHVLRWADGTISLDNQFPLDCIEGDPDGKIYTTTCDASTWQVSSLGAHTDSGSMALCRGAVAATSVLIIG